jgi:hypothetical protein
MITTPLPRFALASIRITVAAFAARQITEEEMPAPEKCAIEHCLINASALSDARFHRAVKVGRDLRARSIKPLEGSRWRLRRMREYWALWDSFSAHSQVQLPYVSRVGDIADHIANDRRCEVACFVLLKCECFPDSEVIGICHFRRTWCNNIVLDYLAGHPFIVRPPRPMNPHSSERKAERQFATFL